MTFPVAPPARDLGETASLRLDIRDAQCRNPGHLESEATARSISR